MFSLTHRSVRGIRKSGGLLKFFTLLTVCLSYNFSFSQAALNGTFTISTTGGDYDAFADAVADLLSRGVDGPVVFEVADGTYNEQFTITSVPGAGAGNPITFQPQSGNPCGVTLTFGATGPADNWIVRLEGADYITFKNLCFSATGANYARVFHLLLGADNNTITGCTLGSVMTTQQSFNLAIFYVQVFSTEKNDNNLISNNIFSDGSYGVYFEGSTSNPSTGNELSANTFNGQYKTGIYLRFQDSPTISGNQITSLDPSIGGYRGIHVKDCPNAAKIVKNQLNMSNGIGFYIEDCPGGSSAPGLVANNFLLSKGSSTGNLIQPDNSTYYNIYYNTMLNTGNSSACVSVVNNATNIEIVNNIAVNSASGLVYEIQSPIGVTNSNYNNLYTTGSTLAFWGGNSQSTLPDLRTASSMEANSVSKSVTFSDAANANLHLAGQSIGDLALAGTALASVTDDYDGDLRDALLPYMGADENIQTPLPVELTSFTAQVTSNGVTLSWITATETNNLGFEVQKRHATAVWQKIAFITGHGTTTEPQFYDYVDAKLSPGQYEYRLKQIDVDGAFSFSEVLTVEIMPPAAFQLSQNYPNPFNPETFIAYQLAGAARVEIAIYNSLGKRIRNLLNESRLAGNYQLIWDGKNNTGKRVASGTYFYTLKVDGNLLSSKRMILVK